MNYDQMIENLTERGESSIANLCTARRAALTAALMEQVAEEWRLAFITDSPFADHYPDLLNQALHQTISPAELGQALIDGAIHYAAGRVERDLRRTPLRVA